MKSKVEYSILAHSRPDRIGTPRILPHDCLNFCCKNIGKINRSNTIFYLFAIIGYIFFVSTAYAQDFTINNFHSDIIIREDSSITVKETIDVEFHRPRHGIYRDIPFRYTDELGNTLRTPLDILSVTDASGTGWKYNVTRKGDAVNIRIGDAKKYVDGNQTYVITYSVENTILFFEGHDELYWNVTGNYWNAPIKKASVNINLAVNNMSKDLRASCYTGALGSRESQCDFKVSSNIGEFLTKKGLDTGEGLTVAFGWNKGLVSQPSSWKKFLWAIDMKENWVFLLPVCSLIFMINLWNRVGRDPRIRESITVMYEPPKYKNMPLTPAEAGTILDEKLDPRDITSTIVGLAVKGYIKIEETKKEGLIFNSTDYYLSRVKETDNNLSPFEKELMSSLFPDPVYPGILVSDMKNNFYRYLDLLKTTLYGELVRKGYFLRNPGNVRALYITAGIIVMVFTGVATGIISSYSIGKNIIAGILTGIPMLAFSKYMPAKTKAGSSAYMDILGFQEFMNRAEKDKLERMGDKDLFSKFLPYAIALDVADNWAKAFEGIYQEPPQWYVSQTGFGTFHPYRFYGSMNSMISNLGSVMYSSPRGSGIGGSSGSGGGGFSGGGFGGGGGGSW